jgi:hypothetical protein
MHIEHRIIAYEGLRENGYDTRDALVKHNHEEERMTNKSC